MSVPRDAGESLDGVQLAILSSRFDSVVRNMVNTLLRTGRSGVLNTARDFSCCILTADCELLAIADPLPIHVLSGPDLMARSMKELHPTIRKGDAFLHNSPYHGNSHAADHSILIPVIDDSGVHHFTVLAKAHQADCGNAIPTTYSATARDVYEEGALLFPCVKVQQAYEDCEDILRMCKLRIRVPDQWWGDYLALLGAARIGERRILELADEYGWETLHEFAGQWFDYSERTMVGAIEELPEAELTVTAAHDPFPGVPDGIEIDVRMTIHSSKATIEVDLRDNPDCQPCGLNLSEATARTAVMLGIFNSLHRAIPPNAGSFRRILIHLRENCVVGIPRHPVSCSVATTNLADRVASAVQLGMAQLGEGIGLAETGSSQPPAEAVLSGLDPRSGGSAYVNQIILPAITGGPGGPGADGWLTLGNPALAGVAFRDSIEIDEIHHPIQIDAQYIVPDTEGAGRFRGAPSAYVEYGPVDTTIEAVYVSDGTVFPARGARGGLDGAPASQFKRMRNGDVVPVEACARVVLEPGETIISVSCGGGGYGPPGERDPERVRRDLEEGWISADRATSVYGLDERKQ